MFHFNVLVVSWKGKTVTRKALHPRNDCRHWIVPAGSFLTTASRHIYFSHYLSWKVCFVIVPVCFWVETVALMSGVDMFVYPKTTPWNHLFHHWPLFEMINKFVIVCHIVAWWKWLATMNQTAKHLLFWKRWIRFVLMESGLLIPLYWLPVLGQWHEGKWAGQRPCALCSGTASWELAGFLGK